MRVHHVAVIVEDLARSEAFYSGVLQLPVLKRWTDDCGLPRSVWLKLGEGAFLALEARVSSAGLPGELQEREAGPELASPRGTGWHCVTLGIAASERELWRARIHGAGRELARETQYTIYVRDPDGNLVGLSHWPTEV